LLEENGALPDFLGVFLFSSTRVKTLWFPKGKISMIIDMTISATEQKLTEKQLERVTWHSNTCGFEPYTINFFANLAASCVKLELSEWDRNTNCEPKFNEYVETLGTSNNSTYFANISFDADSSIKWTNCSPQVD